MKRFYKWVIFFVIVAGIAQIGITLQAQGQMTLKNVQVLKGKTYPEVMQYMAAVVAPGLGVQCTSCHDPKDYSSDAKADKVTARKMLKMMTEMNDKYFADPKSKTVTCYMCHRGKEMPLMSASEIKEKSK